MGREVECLGKGKVGDINESSEECQSAFSSARTPHTLTPSPPHPGSHLAYLSVSPLWITLV
jgi:hypothetical protein